MRHGITPVIALLLLLMMAVAAAAGAFIWMNALQEDVREQTGQDIQSETTTLIEIISLTCYNKNNDGRIEAILANSGNTLLDLNPVDIDIREGSSAQLNTTLSKSSVSLFQTDIATQPTIEMESTTDIEQPGNRAFYNITLPSPGFQNDQQYIVEFVFTDENGVTSRGECRAFTDT